MTMEQRVSLITLGVPDIEQAAAFYAALGWQAVESPDGVVAFDLISQTLGLYPLDKLAEDIGLPVEAMGTGAMTLSYNTRSREEVDDMLALAREAGGEILRPGGEVFWGAISVISEHPMAISGKWRITRFHRWPTMVPFAGTDTDFSCGVVKPPQILSEPLQGPTGSALACGSGGNISCSRRKVTARVRGRHARLV
ncbi:MAG: catechol 2,3-dioxygenase-like lactoylglutathione lyase family enzyme [Pseudophaeobacter arcticus]|jgi:catechol 2,3-dioxygenase-like lactoylglutathione lyase family enzyme